MHTKPLTHKKREQIIQEACSPQNIKATAENYYNALTKNHSQASTKEQRDKHKSVVFVCGIPASGKSVVVDLKKREYPGIIFVDQDDVIKKLPNFDKVHEQLGETWSQDLECLSRPARKLVIEKLAKESFTFGGEAVTSYMMYPDIALQHGYSAENIDGNIVLVADDVAIVSNLRRANSMKDSNQAIRIYTPQEYKDKHPQAKDSTDNKKRAGFVQRFDDSLREFYKKYDGLSVKVYIKDAGNVNSIGEIEHIASHHQYQVLHKKVNHRDKRVIKNHADKALLEFKHRFQNDHPEVFESFENLTLGRHLYKNGKYASYTHNVS
jgi:Zeta toxin